MIQYVDSGLSEREHLKEIDEKFQQPLKPRVSWLKDLSTFKFSKKISIILIIIFCSLLLLGGLFYFAYNNFYILVNAKSLLLKRFNTYNEVASAGHCEQAYEFLTESTKTKISLPVYNFVCQQESDLSIHQYIAEKLTITDLIISGKKAIITTKKIIREDSGPLEYNEDYIFVVEKNNWYRDFSQAQIDFYYQEVVNGKNKVFLDCLMKKNTEEEKSWLEAGQPQDWRYFLDEEGKIQYNWDEGAEHFQAECIQVAEDSEAGELVKNLNLESSEE
jgi:hypothetical protein